MNNAPSSNRNAYNPESNGSSNRNTSQSQKVVEQTSSRVHQVLNNPSKK